jgi:DNA processing protein
MTRQTNTWLLAVSYLKGVGVKTARSVLENVGRAPESADELASSLAALKAKVKKLNKVDLGKGTVLDAWFKAEDTIAQLHEDEQCFVSIQDEDYPPLLKRLEDAPLFLFIKTRQPLADLWKRPCVAVVGTREPTEYGRRLAFRLGERFAESDCNVVSGLAIGCDTSAHEGCLAAKGTTISVLAHGLDTVYPAKNRHLAAKIVDEGGALLSEYPPGTSIQRQFFVERDRIQSGLSSATVVVETGVKGGTLHTAEFTTKQGRTLAVVRHPERFIRAEKAQGNKLLLSKPSTVPLATEDDLVRLIARIHVDPQVRDGSPAGVAGRPSVEDTTGERPDRGLQAGPTEFMSESSKASDKDSARIGEIDDSRRTLSAVGQLDFFAD